MTALIMVGVTPWASWLQLAFIGLVLLPILLIQHGDQLQRRRVCIAVLLAALLAVPATIYAVDVMTYCDDWDSLVNTFGYHSIRPEIPIMATPQKTAK